MFVLQKISSTQSKKMKMQQEHEIPRLQGGVRLEGTVEEEEVEGIEAGAGVEAEDNDLSLLFTI